MAGAPSDDDILEAVERRLAQRGVLQKLHTPGAATIARCPLLDCRIVRSVEIRREQQRTHHGAKDLSTYPTYQDLTAYPCPPPRDPATSQQHILVLRGSVRERHCDCGNGKVGCPRCKGRGRLSCDPRTVCLQCRGADPCRVCRGTGRRRHVPRTSALPADGDLVTCTQCGAREAACPTCTGRGTLTCPICNGTEVITCADCTGKGTINHAACGGEGRTTSWTEGTISHTPQEAALVLPKKPLPLVVRQRTRSQGQWRSAQVAGNDQPPEDLDATHRAAIGRVWGERPNEVARSTNIRHLALARVEVAADPHRVYYVFPTPTGVQAIWLPSPRLVERVLAWGAGFIALLIVIFVMIH
ncbi:hypothetical protein ABZ721_35685 [Streptomyces sp. NPDC006733]|uniref:hypothetical protein n=1 Tax=Streptomyces sp. NPDC006733 TaxID=3155460 RepID=UPI0034109378